MHFTDEKLLQLLETSDAALIGQLKRRALAVLCGGKQAGLDAGANVVMPVFTPEEEKFKYDLYQGKRHV